MNIETAFFILRTSDLSSNNSRGSANDTNSSFTWNNMNLRLILGTMYDRYDLFNLSLKSMSSGVPSSAIASDTDDLNVLLYCSGLPFINQTYDVVNGTTPNTILGTFQFSGAMVTDPVYDSKMFYDSRYATFGKSQEMLNFSIFYKSVTDNSYPIADLGHYPDVVLMFEITGIPKEVGNMNGTRMFS
jgi:hypothetical protein